MIGPDGRAANVSCEQSSRLARVRACALRLTEPSSFATALERAPSCAPSITAARACAYQHVRRRRLLRRKAPGPPKFWPPCSHCSIVPTRARGGRVAIHQSRLSSVLIHIHEAGGVLQLRDATAAVQVGNADYEGPYKGADTSDPLS